MADLHNNNPDSEELKKLSMLAKVTLWINLIICGAVILISLLSVFFYAPLSRMMGQPYDGLIRLNPWLVRGMFLFGVVIYLVAVVGCILMLKQRKRGFWIYAVPAFMLFAASLFLVFSALTQLQLVILAASLLILSIQRKNMR